MGEAKIDATGDARTTAVGAAKTGGPHGTQANTRPRRMVFHTPYPLNRQATSASGIRPVAMRDAFEELGYEVWEVTGTSQERVAAASRVRRALAEGIVFDFCYSESSTMPTLLTDPDHRPRHPLVDFALLRTLRAHGTRVGLFYRDIYWRFPDYGKGLPKLRKHLALAAYRHDLRAYRSATDIVFLPSTQMEPHVGDPALRHHPLPPGHRSPELVEAAPSPVNLFYVGGIGTHYRLHALVEAMAEVPETQLTICCREAEWQAARQEYEPLPRNVQVVHRSGSELDELYRAANVAVIYTEPASYREFAAPVKLYEYIGQGKPIMASQGSLVGDFVHDNDLGWTIPYSREDAVALLRALNEDPSQVHAAHQRVVRARGEHSWLERARTVARLLSRPDPMPRATEPAVRRVLLVSAANSIHTARWANGLAARGVDVHVASVHPADEQDYDEQVSIHRLPSPAGGGYLVAAPALRSLVTALRPDLVNTHFASGYGTLSRLALAGLQVPHLVSVWGSDVYEFPDRHQLARRVLESNLAAATRIASTSRAMARRTSRFTDLPIDITPFGVDTSLFHPDDLDRTEDEVVVGTVKLLKPVYGIDVLMKAFARAQKVVQEAGGPRLRLRITGDGPAREELSVLARELGLPETVLCGSVPHEQVPQALHELDVYVALSRQESFGAAILEASACGLPVVVSDAEGPKEVTVDEQSGIIVGIDDVEAAAQAIARLALDADLRRQMGRAGREHVEQHYSWSHSVDTMLEAYRATMTEALRA